MDVKIEEYRRNFDRLTDEALLEIKRGDLVEAARECLDQELVARGLNTPSEEEQPGGTDNSHQAEEMVLLDTFMTASEAELAEALLKANGIHCQLGDTMAAAGLPTYAAEGLPLFVPARHREQAELILTADISDEELAAQAEAAGQVEE
jgi:hypothetical protein